jgi:hypothetical protein
MEDQMHGDRTLLALFAGGALGVGAGLLVSRACAALDHWLANIGKKRAPSDSQDTSALNSAVPEGAGILYAG